MGRIASGRVMIAAALAAGCVFGTAAVAAPVPDPVATEQGSTEAERRGGQALASLQYPWRELGYSVEFRDYRGGTLGTANSRTKNIAIYVKREHTHQALRVTIAHELGHALDFEHATAARRHDYRDIRELSQSARWYPCDDCTDYRSHAGDWAEVFASRARPDADARPLTRLAPSARRRGPGHK